jgi:hypothetical protein
MSDIIRSVRQSFLPMPRDSQDAPVPSFANHYAAMNRMSEREQLQNQRNVARLTRTVKQSSFGAASPPQLRTSNGGILQITGVVYGVTR